jgi:ADP-ribose pyrophosphatase YjhB (NUDIX family)
MRPATLVFLLRGDPPQEILLGFKKARFGAGKYNGFGGKVQDGESVTQAAIRELQEEAGVRVHELDLRQVAVLTFFFPAKPAWNQVVHAFMATQWDGIPAESDEMTPCWFAIDQIPYDRMWQDDARWLPRVLSGERVQGRFTFGEDNETLTDVEVEPLAF